MSRWRSRIGAIISGYVFLVQHADWSAHSSAAQSAAMQKFEQIRAAKWDTWADPAVDQVVSSNFPTTVTALDLPMVTTVQSLVTNITTITTLSANPPLKLVRVDSVWRYPARGLQTNTIISYRSPDQ